MRGRSIAAVLMAVLPAVLIAAPPAAEAKILRAPPKGEPAISIDASDDWEPKVEDDNIALTAKAGHAYVHVGTEVNPTIGQMSLSAIAANVFTAADLPPYVLTLPTTIAGYPGAAFLSVVPPTDTTGTVTIVVILAKLDASHLLALIRATSEGITPDQVALVEKLSNTLKVSGFRKR
ncbi:MAG: hypothetical protein JSR90_14205 [Proteobacteria bacterium]|nr:hypothetical protein [Pseudomonadota bacterium]